MKQDLLKELQRLRNELAHSKLSPDAQTVSDHFRKLGLEISADEIAPVIPVLLRSFQPNSGVHFVPPVLLDCFTNLLEDRSAAVVCDPWAGLGSVIATITRVTRAARSIAFTQNADEAVIGRLLSRTTEWHVGDPLQLVTALDCQVDVFASILPFGARTSEPLSIPTASGESIRLRGELGNLMLAAAASKLTEDGVGLFVLPPSFFFAEQSVLRSFSALGLGLEAALALPSGTFAPYTNIESYLTVIRRRPCEKTFVARLSTDPVANRELISNFKAGREGGPPELGRFVDPMTFRGMGQLQMGDRLAGVERRYGAQFVSLEQLANSFTLGRPTPEFAFPTAENSIYVPLIGTSDVVESTEEMSLKLQNYAQVTLAPSRTDARFVRAFLNTEFGRELRSANTVGTTIQRLTGATLRSLPVVVPPLDAQRQMIELEARLLTEENILHGLQAELSEMRKKVWESPGSAQDVDRQLTVFSGRLAGGVKEHTAQSLDQWFETLPFPLASILRAWQATPSQDHYKKYQHLLHFFEAAAQFASVILLSAFSTNEALMEQHKQKLGEALEKQRLSLERATFGTWKVVVEYLGKQVRLLLAGDEDQRASCANLFADPSLSLPEALSRKELAATLSTTNKMRNDWSGHGGVVGDEESRLRNELLVKEVHNIRSVFAATWPTTQLLRAVHCVPRRGLFENEVAVLMGSNSEFLKETRRMPTWLDVETLYLVHKEASTALRLLPLVKVGPSPQSAKNACYFFSRLEGDRARFVSYHFADLPEVKEESAEATAAIKLLASR